MSKRFKNITDTRDQHLCVGNIRGFGISCVDTRQTVARLNDAISAEKLFQIENVVSSLFRNSPKMMVFLARRLSHVPYEESQRFGKRMMLLVLKRVFKTLKNPFELPTLPPQYVEYYDYQPTHPYLSHFINAIESNFVPFLRGDKSLSLTEIIDILSILKHHLNIADEKMRYNVMIVDSGGQGSDALCSDIRFVCGIERSFEELQDYYAAKESIHVIYDLLKGIEQMLSNFSCKFELYLKMYNKFSNI